MDAQVVAVVVVFFSHGVVLEGSYCERLESSPKLIVKFPEVQAGE